MMFKIRGFATLLVLALSLIAVSCAGPVFFKPPVASVATTAPSAPTQNVAAAGAPGAAAVAGSASAAPAVAPASTQPSVISPVLAYLAAVPMNGVTIFALFTLALLVTIGFLNFFFSGLPTEKKPK